MVRGPASVLALIAVGWVYFLIPADLPALHPEDLSIIVSGSVALVILVAVACGVAALADVPYLAVLVLLGSGLVAGALNAADVGAGATIPETVAYTCVGVLFGVALEQPALVIALPLFVAGVDVISLLGDGPSHTLAEGVTQPGDPLSLELPDWQNGLAAARIGLADVVFLGVFATFARRFHLRLTATAVGMALGLIAGLVLHVIVDDPVPQLPFLAAGFLLPNIDLLPGLFRTPAQG